MPNLVSIAPGFQLDSAAAASYLRARAAGCPAGITSAYRSPAAQAYLRARYLAAKALGHGVAYAAPVNRSEHVTGQALDLHAGAAAWFRTHSEYGFVFTDPSEWWHVAYRIERDQYLGVSIDPTSPTPVVTPPTPKDVPMFMIRNRASGVIAIVGEITLIELNDQHMADLHALKLGPWLDCDPADYESFRGATIGRINAAKSSGF